VMTVLHSQNRSSGSMPVTLTRIIESSTVSKSRKPSAV
jgi:hypothetical protein